ncbi:MAG TPA: hypothetical protein VL172_11455, partial [Kofleriaceae bacterium]|nr:hypothetical protein [Kofleriaceae bacterium]
MSDAPAPTDDAERDATPEGRVADLATGFALGELNETELREFYDHLRDPSERGTAAARIAWQQLGIVTDLRAQLGSGFQQTVKHRVDREGFSDRFVRDARKRLGAQRPMLGEVSPPESRHTLRLWPFALIAAITLVALGAMALWHRRNPPAPILCRVAEVAGDARLGGRPLVAGMGVDQRQIAVPAGSQVALAWEDGSLAIIAGPANAVAQPSGLSLSNGAAWLAAGSAFTCGLPDDTVRAEPNARVAVEVRDGRSVVGVAEGSAGLTARTLGAGEAANNASVFPWIAWALGDAAPRVEATPDWRLDARATWREPSDVVGVDVRGGITAYGWYLSWRPGQVVATRRTPPSTPADQRTVAL